MELEFRTLLEKLTGKLQGWLVGFVEMLPNLVVAALVVVLFLLVARYGSRLVRAALDRVSSNREVNSLLAGTLRIVLIVVGVFVAFGVLNLDKTVTSLLAGVGIVGLALGFAFQDLAANFMSGIIMAVRHPFREGELVKLGDVYGRVSDMDLRSTRIRTLAGQDVIVPNRKVLENPIENYDRSGKRRVDLAVGVSYGDDLEKVRGVALEAVRGLGRHRSDSDVELFYEGFGASSIDFVVRFWIDDTDEVSWLDARSAAVMAVKAAFDANDITIPFPIRTLDFAKVGGTQLDTMLRAASGPGADADAA